MIETTKLGLAPFDAAVGGIYFNTPTLVRGRRGGGKTILATHFADKVLRTGERLLYFCESQPESVMLDARSAGMDFEAPARSGQLALVPIRSAFSASSMGEFPFFEAIEEMRAMASRLSAGFAVFSSVVPWVAVSPLSAMPRRVDEFLAALSTSSLTSLLLVHKPASHAAEALVAKLSEEVPVVLEMESLRYAGSELRVLKVQGRDDLRLPMAFPLSFVSGKGLTTPAASSAPDAKIAGAEPFAMTERTTASATERPRIRATLFPATGSAPASAHPAVSPALRDRSRGRATLFSAAGAASASAPAAATAPVSRERPRGRATLFSATVSPSASAAPAPAAAPAVRERPHGRATLFASAASQPPQAVPAAPPPPQAVPAAPQPPQGAPPGRSRIQFSNVIR